MPKPKPELWAAALTTLEQLRGRGQYRGRALCVRSQGNILLEAELRATTTALQYVRVVIGQGADESYYQWQGGLHYLKYVTDLAEWMAAACACARGGPHLYTHPDHATYK